jgi:hypothetical protein
LDAIYLSIQGNAITFYMKKYFLISILSFSFLQPVFSQFQGTPVLNHVPIGQLLAGGLPFMVESNENVQGSPFLFDNFFDAFVQLRDEKIYSGIKVRFNLATNKIHYLDQNKKELVANDGVIKRLYIKVFDGVDSIAYTFGCGYPESPGTTVYTYFQEFNYGVASLLRLQTKSIVERKTLATVDPVKQYDEKDSYYVYNSNYKKLVKWKKGKDFILDFLPDKSVEVNSYINQNKLDCKSSDDVIRLIQYYNTLFTK